jgi:hypothetical protein
MESGEDNPAPAPALERSDPSEVPRKRDQRRARVRLLEARRKAALQVERVIETQRAHRRLSRG